MKNLLLLALLFSTSCVLAQEDLALVVKKINAPLFMNNMESQKIYTQEQLDNNWLSFKRNFYTRETEDIEQTFLYRYLPGKKQNFILEFKLDKREINLNSTDSIIRAPKHYSDFGLKIYCYNKRKKSWKEVTLEVLPPDFTYTMKTKLPNLQKGNKLYYYNLNMQQLIEMSYTKKQILWTQKDATLLKLTWKKKKFVWQ